MKGWRAKLFWHRFAAVIVLGIAALLIGACAADSSAPAAAPAPTTASAPSAQPTLQAQVSRAITLGNVDAKSPARRIEELQPLADFLAANLSDLGIAEGRVVIAQSNEEMAQFLEEGKVDIYIDSLVPSLGVCEIADCRFVLRQWKGGDPTSNGVFIAAQNSGVSNIDDLAGKVVALQKEDSTVGFVLPAATIAHRGFKVVEVKELGSELKATEVGYYIAGGDRNAMELLTRGDVGGVAIGEKAYERFDSNIKSQTLIFDKTPDAPSQLVSIRADFDSEVVSRISELFVSLDQIEEGQAILDALRDTKKFDVIYENDGSLNELKELIKLAPGAKQKQK